MSKRSAGFISVFMMIVLFFISCITTYASEIDSISSIQLGSYVPERECGYISASHYYGGITAKTDRSLNRIDLRKNGEQICLLINWDDTIKPDIDVLCGRVYSVSGNGYYDDKMLLGEFTQNKSINIIQFRVFNETTPILTILIENLTTGYLDEYDFQLTKEAFCILMESAKKNSAILNADEDDYLSKEILAAERFLGLLQPAKHFLSEINKDYSRSQSHSSFKSTSSYSGNYASFDTINDFCTSIEASSSSGITPSSTMRTILTQTGWKMYKSSTYFYVMHGVVNTSTERLVGISLVSVSNYKPSSTKVSASYTIAGSCTVLYNKTSQKATLLYSNTGIRLEDATIAIELVGGTTNFHEATKTKNLDSSGTGLLAILVAVSDDLGIASAIWNALKLTDDSSATVDFGSDENQEHLYDGLVRAIANRTASGKYLWSRGNYIGITGLFYNNSLKTYSARRIAWGFTAYSLL